MYILSSFFFVVEAVFPLSRHLCHLFNIGIHSCLTLHSKCSEFMLFLLCILKEEEKVLRGYDGRVT
jgi:hypothetical protein